MRPVSTFIFIATGSLALWMMKGFKGRFNDVMVSIDERNSTRGSTRYFLGLGIWIMIFVIAGVVLSRAPQTRSFRVKTNDKGEIIEWRNEK